MAIKVDTERIDVDKPLWDQSTFVGRFKHFAFFTDPTTCLTSEADLYNAKKLVEQYRLGKEPATTTREQILHAKKLSESAFHPDSGELQNIFGRMSFQVPGGMLITGAMLQFYRTVPQIVFWQWVNQSFNALVNFTNRNANSPLTVTQLGVSYVSATSSALAAAVIFKGYLQKRASPFAQRYVPFAAVAAANCVNIPLMRQNEILDGIMVEDENGKEIGKSRLAAVKGISQVAFSRIFMAAPGMLLLPVIMEKLERYPWFKRMTFFHAPFQTLAVGGFLMFMVPTACSVFPQRCSLSIKSIERFEPELHSEMLTRNDGKLPQKVYFNKGL